MLVLGQDAGRGVEDEQHGVGPLHGMDPAQQAVALEPVTARRLAADTRGVDEHDRNAVEHELGVDGIARRARCRADQRAFVAEQRIQE